jgi:hypothetical protein
MGILKDAFGVGDKKAFNALLVEEFNKTKNLDSLLETIKSEGINLTRRQVIGKLSIMGVKNIVPKAAPKPKKDTGPTKKELIATLCKLVELEPADLLTFNNVKKSELAKLINAISS